ncbi:glycosyltransferase [Bacillus sp. FJAT-49736]|uniref:glycosyltransferase n=1 Tax=Bacillus sp. FJAT-49736 TaxID=2833582 RepID=UPI001BC91724|nr:glycosyltransferase [Bacillus sp. FJAT-49736]MBS4174155.1 glycosyltransferase [Bacillus sp. FJAT-49736]
MSDVLVSINCVSYNHEDFIAEAIESFLMQKTNFEYEILIYDDASTDSTQEIIRRYEKKYPNVIKPIYGKVNQYSRGLKVIGSINNKRARGKYIALCEGDDYWTNPYKLQKQVDYMENNPECTLCAHTVEKVSVKNEKIGYERPYDKSTVCPISDMILGGGYFVGTVSLLFPRKLMENPPEFYYQSPVGDYPLQIILSSKGYTYFIDEAMAAYRVGGKGSWSKKQSTGKDKRNKQIKHANEVISMLKQFNNYTNYEYSEDINKKIKYYEFKNAIVQRDYITIRSNDFYNILDIKKKFSVFIKMIFPNFYQKVYKEYIKYLLYSS